jgi:hypothetical protein
MTLSHHEIFTHDNVPMIVTSFNLNTRKTLHVVAIYTNPVQCV